MDKLFYDDAGKVDWEINSTATKAALTHNKQQKIPPDDVLLFLARWRAEDMVFRHRKYAETDLVPVCESWIVIGFRFT